MVDQPDHSELARRFLDLWQDQMVATATDPDWAEMMARWTEMANSGFGGSLMQNPMFQQFWQMGQAQYGTPSASESDRPGAVKNAGVGDDGDSRAAATSTVGTKTVAGVSSDGSDNVDELRRRVRELEDRLAALENGRDSDVGQDQSATGGNEPPARRPPRRRPGEGSRRTR